MGTSFRSVTLLFFFFIGCDSGTIEDVPDCQPGVWRVCVTDDLTWGRRLCDDDGWGPVCHHQECEPDAELDCLTDCGTPGTSLCEADGFWGVCNHEVCDGADNDCNGEIDEGLVKYCQCGCGDGESWCVDGAWGACAGDGPGSCAPPPGGCGGDQSLKSISSKDLIGTGVNGQPLPASGPYPR